MTNSQTKPLVSIITASSNSGSSCIRELYERYSDRLNVRAVFRSEDKAKPFREAYPGLEVVTDVDAYRIESLKKAFQDVQYTLIVTPHDHSKFMEFANDATLTENMINVAVEMGVKYIVLVGSFSAPVADKIKLIGSRFKPAEDLLAKLSKDKGLKYTVLRGKY
jgi:hypothetical protein